MALSEYFSLTNIFTQLWFKVLQLNTENLQTTESGYVVQTSAMF